MPIWALHCKKHLQVMSMFMFYKHPNYRVFLRNNFDLAMSVQLMSFHICFSAHCVNGLLYEYSIIPTDEIIETFVRCFFRIYCTASWCSLAQTPPNSSQNSKISIISWAMFLSSFIQVLREWDHIKPVFWKEWGPSGDLLSVLFLRK